VEYIPPRDGPTNCLHWEETRKERAVAGVEINNYAAIAPGLEDARREWVTSTAQIKSLPIIQISKELMLLS